jgi:hypothetical protein
MKNRKKVTILQNKVDLFIKHFLQAIEVLSAIIQLWQMLHR